LRVVVKPDTSSREFARYQEDLRQRVAINAVDSDLGCRIGEPKPVRRARIPPFADAIVRRQHVEAVVRIIRVAPEVCEVFLVHREVASDAHQRHAFLRRYGVDLLGSALPVEQHIVVVTRRVAVRAGRKRIRVAEDDANEVVVVAITRADNGKRALDDRGGRLGRADEERRCAIDGLKRAGAVGTDRPVTVG
jgi:hypothetical protein